MAVLVGGAVGFGVGFFLTLLSVIPLLGIIFSLMSLFSPGIGGGVAGYLRGNDHTEGILVGAGAGCITVLPSLVFGILIAVLFGLFATGTAAQSPELSVVSGVSVIALFAIGLLITLVSGLVVGGIGGLIGAELTDRPAPKP